ncbi:MAG: 4Fe-4S binding protein [bacterium]|nr:4Fe-4S binding protein [bacterium]
MADKERSLVYEADGVVIALFPDLCNSCGKCIEKCPKKALGWSEDAREKIAILDIRLCDACGGCQEACPEKALKVKKNF